jgi:hypothetical protein
MLALENNSAVLTIPERVAELLKINKPDAFCDDCIASSLGMRREQVNTVTSTLGLCREYSRGSETCTVCRRQGKFATNYLGE